MKVDEILNKYVPSTSYQFEPPATKISRKNRVQREKKATLRKKRPTVKERKTTEIQEPVWTIKTPMGERSVSIHYLSERKIQKQRLKNEKNLKQATSKNSTQMYYELRKKKIVRKKIIAPRSILSTLYTETLDPDLNIRKERF